MSFEETYRSPDESVVQFRFKRPEKTCYEVRRLLLDFSNNLANAIRDKIVRRELVSHDEIVNLEHINAKIEELIEELKECV